MKCLAFALVSVIFILNATPSKCEQRKDGMTAYIKGSVPNQIYRCIQRFNILRCLKYFVLLRLEARDVSLTPLNSTNEFLGNILKNVGSLPSEIPESLAVLKDDELNERLTRGFQQFFLDRPIKLHFIPSMLVKVVPSRSNDLEINLKRTVVEAKESGRQLKAEDNKVEEDDDDDYEDYKEEEEEEDPNKKDATPTDDKKEGEEGMKGDNMNEKQGGLRKRRGYFLQFGLPMVLAPYMVFAGFLPLLIPVLKIATAFTAIVNVTALVASIMYLARQQALEKEMQQTVYFNPGYKERK